MTFARPSRGSAGPDTDLVEQLLSRTHDDPRMRRQVYEFFDHEGRAWFHTGITAVASSIGIGMTLTGILEAGAKLAGVSMLVSALLYVGPSAIKASRRASRLSRVSDPALASRAIPYTLAGVLIGVCEVILGISPPNTNGLMVLLLPLTVLLALAYADRRRTRPMVQALDARGGAQ
ncbi:hypothetical protein ACT17_23060 [Mycolicibacterium conceptionense]|uniref:Uncharacterized protein n=1 Tax=Mycolicibacterium conceptionense TaxID=451644 RepID=A0A0J8U4G7_9MYCO|nr:hypothetical protein [Mycolicibacterium conceptionense]KMV15972.1 hypothetical protein ACT17_23060 [Mycolicibacterium conceptionense]